MSSQSINAIVLIATVFLTIASMWRLFTKSGEAGWKSLIPIYGAVVLLRMVGRPWWWMLLLLVPVVNLYPAVMLCFDLAKAFVIGMFEGVECLHEVIESAGHIFRVLHRRFEFRRCIQGSSSHGIILAVRGWRHRADA